MYLLAKQTVLKAIPKLCAPNNIETQHQMALNQIKVDTNRQGHEGPNAIVSPYASVVDHSNAII